METPEKFSFKKLSISQSANNFYVKYDNKPVSFKFVNVACTNIIKSNGKNYGYVKFSVPYDDNKNEFDRYVNYFKNIFVAFVKLIDPSVSKEDIINNYKEGGYLKPVFNIRNTNNVIFSVTVFDDKIGDKEKYTLCDITVSFNKIYFSKDNHIYSIGLRIDEFKFKKHLDSDEISNYFAIKHKLNTEELEQLAAF
jgi:hypothetical protein